MRREYTIRLRVSEKEKESILDAAKRNGTTISNYLRQTSTTSVK